METTATDKRDEEALAVAARRPERYRRIACLSVAPWNPYLRLLYDSLAERGFALEPGVGHLSAHRLVAARHRVGFLHIHWPEGLYRFGRGPRQLSGPLSWLKLGLFAMRLRLAHALGYRLVWTIHQIYPHDSPSRRLDRRAAIVLAQSCDILVAHDAFTAQRAQRELGVPHVEIVPHGSYVGVYPRGRPRAVVRDELGIPHDAVVFLCFGELRAYNDVDFLLDAFRTASLPPVVLLVAGHVKDQRVRHAMSEAAAADDRIRWIDGFVASERVAELYEASDAAVVPRCDGGTSGSLILALSLETPVVASDAPTYREVTLDGAAGWLFRPGDTASLREALERAAREPQALAAKGRVASEAAARLGWAGSAERLVSLLTAAKG